MSNPLLLRHSLRQANLHLRVPAFNRLFRRQSWSTLTKGPSSLTVDTLKATFPYVWLRDSCQSPECIHPTTSQKLHKSSDIPLDVKPIEGGVRLLDDGIAIEWKDGHKSHFPISFLERHSSRKNLVAFHKQIVSKPWNNRIITQTRDLFISYGSLQTSEGMLAALKQICRYGLLFVRDVPHKETSDEKCELSTLAEMFGHIRTTFYGRLWDVRNVRNSKNVAYTNLDLGLHMDLLYLEHPPRYQILHCLRNRVQGGQSLFVDAVHCATLLQKSHPSDFDILAATPVAFHYINDGHHLHREHATIELANPSSGTPPGMISHINYSPPFQAPLPLSTPDAFYPALKHFTEALNDPLNTYRYTLQEGDAVIFDNRRVLHSRTAFNDIDGQEKEGETNRWLKGCYLEADDLLDRRRVLEAKL
ncbi:hypothetical protein E4T56_gene6885 [Termitomyces sp. T112]|nr:hypothetical protein C0989_003163 [Termitomyces sp. Mn162]KAG5719958.1 hypothetical protein E4T56_gene6885 [Termitomyces sp. T112]KAH0587057.1 hypothetical protein H2248_005876 [Termitomyces sp. 'cryptogamus']KNZ73645.1 Trimethyllysine dioxygenase, mitochondrial [Termitomyces sp. J132]